MEELSVELKSSVDVFRIFVSVFGTRIFDLDADGTGVFQRSLGINLLGLNVLQHFRKHIQEKFGEHVRNVYNRVKVAENHLL